MKQAVCIIFFVLSLPSLSISQSYNFEKLTASYVKLSNDKTDIRLNLGKPWGRFGDASIIVPFNVLFFKSDSNKLGVSAESIATFIDKDSLSSIALCRHAWSWYMDKNYDKSKSDFEQVGESASKVSYEVTGQAGARILKIEYDNVQFEYSQKGKDSVFFQVWFFEKDGAIEFHFGPSVIGTPEDTLSQGLESNYICSLMEPRPGGNQANETLSLQGNPSSPQLMYTPYFTRDIKLNAFPSNGTVYRFERKTLGLDVLYQANVFAQLSNANLSITNKENELMQYTLVDLSGKLIDNGHIQPNSTINKGIIDANSGLYLLRLSSSSKAKTIKLFNN